jgi:hypothetical protein
VGLQCKALGQQDLEHPLELLFADLLRRSFRLRAYIEPLRSNPSAHTRDLQGVDSKGVCHQNFQRAGCLESAARQNPPSRAGRIRVSSSTL